MHKIEAIEKARGVTRLAEIFGITRSAVSQWPDGELPTSRLYELMVKRPEWFTTDAAEQTATERAESRALATAHNTIQEAA